MLKEFWNNIKKLSFKAKLGYTISIATIVVAIVFGDKTVFVIKKISTNIFNNNSLFTQNITNNYSKYNVGYQKLLTQKKDYEKTLSYIPLEKTAEREEYIQKIAEINKEIENFDYDVMKTEKSLDAGKVDPERLSLAKQSFEEGNFIEANRILSWGPARQTYTIENPSDYVTFNSITNNPSHGDERNFVQVREESEGNEMYVDSISLTAGHEYDVYIYYANDAASNLDANGTAFGAYVKAEIPAIVPNGSFGTSAVGYIGADNANPPEVWKNFAFSNTTGRDISLKYVTGSATIHTFGAMNGKTLSDNIVTTGASLGYDNLNGVIPGDEKYAGYVTLRVRAY